MCMFFDSIDEKDFWKLIYYYKKESKKGKKRNIYSMKN